MIGVSKKPETIVSGSCRVVPNFAITILDLSYAHIEGIEPGYVRLHPQVTNVIISPNIHDPLFDFISIYDAMKPVYGIDREIESIVNNNKVIEDNIIGTRRYYPMRDLYQGLCIWSTYNPNGLSVDIVTNLYAKYLVGLAYDLGLSLGPILVGATELNYRVEYIANNIDPEPFFKNIDELSKHQQIRSVFVTMISGAYATEKMELISQYTSTSDDILRQCLKYLRFNSRKQSYSNVDTTTILISE
jgi:hypothetical protein